MSVDDTVHIHRVPELPADAWLPAVFEARDAADGLVLERGRIAAPDGSMIAESFHTRLLALAGPADVVGTLR